MKKIGIITFHSSLNCGSMLQAYALQQVVNEMDDVDCKIIDFSNKSQKRIYSIFVIPRNFKDFLKNIATLPFYFKFKKSQDNHLKFLHDHLILTKESFETEDELKQIDGVYDYLICGSDQVWNITCGDADDSYFLSFAQKGTKIAYAVSLGAVSIERNTNDISKYIKYINEFDYLSVRENKAKERIGKLTNKKIEILLDPTLLYTASYWDKFVSESVDKREYILYYAFSFPKEVNDVVQNISKRLNLPVLMIDAKSWAFKGLFFKGFKLTDTYGPISFLNVIKNAKLVLTTSFHGTVFSVLYEKKFWNLKSSMNNSEDDRAITLLDQVNLSNRMISIHEILERDLLEEIDFEKTNKNLDILRMKSREFLQRALNNIK